MISPTTVINFAAGLAQLAESRARHSQDRVQSHDAASTHTRKEGMFRSAINRIPEQPLISGHAVSMHRDNAKEFRREAVRSMHSAA